MRALLTPSPPGCYLLFGYFATSSNFSSFSLLHFQFSCLCSHAAGHGWHFQALKCFVLAHPSTPHPAVPSCWAAWSAAFPAAAQESPGILVWSKIDPNFLFSVVSGSQFGPSASWGCWSALCCSCCSSAAHPSFIRDLLHVPWLEPSRGLNAWCLEPLFC